MHKRVVLLIIDGFGIGDAPDTNDFGDYGANTCQHILEQNPSLSLPTLQKLGLLDKNPKNLLIEINPNKDTLSGISEMFGSIHSRERFLLI
jgi:phosphopentomutase